MKQYMKEYTITYTNQYEMERKYVVIGVSMYGALSYFLSICEELEIEADIIKIEKGRYF